MANEIQLKFGTFTLDNGAAYCVDDIQISEKKNVSTHEIPKTDGEIAEEAKRKAITITVTGTIGGADYDALRTLIDAMNAAVHGGIQKFTMDDDRYIKAQVDSFRKKWITFRTLASFEINITAHYPFFLAETPSVSDTTPTSTVGYTITNNGNAPARVKIEITPSAEMADECKIENQTNGKSFQYRGTVAATEKLEIDNFYDGDEFQVLNDGADDIENFEGDFITLEPGDNTIVFTGTASTNVVITHRDTWY